MSDKNAMIEKMAKAFMVLPISVGRVPLKLDTHLGREGAVKAMGEGIDAETGKGVGSTVPALGALTGKAKTMLNRPMGQVRTFCYTETQEFERGKRLVAVPRLPEALTKLADARQQVLKNWEVFRPEYQRYYNLRDGVLVKGGRVRNGVACDLPMITPDKLEAAVYVDVGVPERIPTADLSGMALPAGLAADIATRTNASQIAKVEAMRTRAMTDMLAQVEKIMVLVDPDGKGERYSNALFENAGRATRNLREIVESYDSDPRLLQLADLIDEHVTGRSVDAVKNSATSQERILRATKTVVKGLRDMSKAQPAVPQPTATTVVAGDSLLADLID